MATQVQVRVNGIQISRMRVRRKLVNGVPAGDFELVIEDPILGMFAIDDNQDIPYGASSFLLEVKDMTIPAAERNRMPSKGWKKINEEDLLNTLIQIGALDGYY